MKLRARSKEERKSFIHRITVAAENLRQIVAGLGDDEPPDPRATGLPGSLPRRSWANAGFARQWSQFTVEAIRHPKSKGGNVQCHAPPVPLRDFPVGAHAELMG